MRQIALDTETTGIGHEQGHRIIEIGCVELYERKFTGRHFQVYINPERAVDEGAFRVHGISTEFLKDKPPFKDVVNDLLQFIEGAELVIHNAAFDVGFLNAELRRIEGKSKLEAYCTVCDTLILARAKYPGQRNSLDALCKRFDIDNSNRQLHGALLDAELLASAYLAMTGGQASFFTEGEVGFNQAESKVQEHAPLDLTNPVIINASTEELQRHQEFLQGLVKKSSVDYWNT